MGNGKEFPNDFSIQIFLDQRTFIMVADFTNQIYLNTFLWRIRQYFSPDITASGPAFTMSSSCDGTNGNPCCLMGSPGAFIIRNINTFGRILTIYITCTLSDSSVSSSSHYLMIATRTWSLYQLLTFLSRQLLTRITTPTLSVFGESKI